jgi:hypothetical protein
MRELERLLALFVAAVILAAGARRVGAPYPVKSATMPSTRSGRNWTGSR